MRLDTYIGNPFVARNSFLTMTPETSTPPTFDEARPHLPSPYWRGHESTINCYWKVWQIAFRNIRRPMKENGFVANFIDTAFNDNLFLWDSSFILLFARYARSAFDFQRTLDNLYAKQHPDGFICREIVQKDGEDFFERFDPASTGPNVLAWSEWEYYLNFGDVDRLRRVFPPLAAYHQWLRTFRTWQDGSYWSSGLGCGMDNQPRVPVDDVNAVHPHEVINFGHGHMSWIDTSLQQALSAKILIAMAVELGHPPTDVRDFEVEYKRLTEMVNDKMWSSAEAFYFDRYRDGSLSGVKTIGAYWALLAGVVPSNQIAPFVAHLDDPREFNRPHRVPALSADHPLYRGDGDYWRGGVWPPTNYMVLRGLTAVGRDALAYDIGRNHVDNVTRVYDDIGTVCENYAPESASKGNPSMTDFVGWGGLGPTAVLLEYVFGLRPNARQNRLVWDIRLIDEHGVSQYPFGSSARIDLHCEARRGTSEKPIVRIESTLPVEVEVRWDGGSELIHSGGAR